jgi:hypothetical protein
VDLTTARLEVRERLGELSANFFTDVEVDRAINQAVQHFNAEEQWPWLFTEFTGQIGLSGPDDDELALPDDVSLNRMFNVSASGGSLSRPQMVERVAPDAGFRLRFAYTNHQRDPRYYYLTSAVADVGNGVHVTYTMKFIPQPNTTYDLEAQYLRTPGVMAGANDLTDCPKSYDDAIPSWASGKLFLKEFGISQKASEQFALYADTLAQARRDTLAQSQDEVVAWGRELPENRFRSERDYVTGRIPPTLG